MFKYSIIIPVFNAERFIVNCVKSITMQTYDNYEIILVDDGSTDNSPQICDDFSEEYGDKVVTVHCTNGGTSTARNIGLKLASGDYVGFMDNDDFWRTELGLEKIDHCLSRTNADLIVYNATIYDDNNQHFHKNNSTLSRKDILGKSYEKSIKKMIKSGSFSETVWTKFVKKSIIIDNQIFFPENMRCEDIDWTVNLLRHISSVDICDVNLYAYRKGNSYSQTSKPILHKHLSDMQNILIKNVEYAENCIDDVSRKDTIFDFLAYPYAVWLGQMSFFKPSKEEKDILKKLFFLLKHSERISLKGLYVFCRIFGLECAKKALKILFLIKYPFLVESGNDDETVT